MEVGKMERIEKYWGATGEAEVYCCRTCKAIQDDTWGMGYGSDGYWHKCTCGEVWLTPELVLRGGEAVTVEEAREEALAINRELDFWVLHTVVRVNGVDMICTRGNEDSPMEML